METAKLDRQQFMHMWQDDPKGALAAAKVAYHAGMDIPQALGDPVEDWLSLPATARASLLEIVWGTELLLLGTNGKRLCRVEIPLRAWVGPLDGYDNWKVGLSHQETVSGVVNIAGTIDRMYLMSDSQKITECWVNMSSYNVVTGQAITLGSFDFTVPKQFPGQEDRDRHMSPGESVANPSGESVCESGRWWSTDTAVITSSHINQLINMGPTSGGTIRLFVGSQPASPNDVVASGDLGLPAPGLIQEKIYKIKTTFEAKLTDARKAFTRYTGLGGG